MAYNESDTDGHYGENYTKQKLVHFFLAFFLGGGVCANAFIASSNLTPLKLGSIVSASFFSCFDLFDFATDSLSTPRNMRGFWFHKVIALVLFPLVPSNHLLIG